MTNFDDTRATSGLFDGRYRISRRLGAGGMARVFLAEDTELHRQIAIKVLSDRYSDDAQFVERFAREARAAAGLNHPNIVQVYDRGYSNGAYYIAMEYLDGETLKDVIVREGKLAPRRAIDITLQLLAALRFAHSNDIVHRDVKPHNVMVLADGRIKVTDFGIAKAGASEMTEAGSIVGTAQYLAPEQARGLAVGPPADLYSVGVVLYEMLTGRVPFTGDSAVAIAMKHVQEPPTPPRRLVPSIPPDLEQVVLRALAKDPQRRYRSADEFGVDLDRVRKGLGVSTATAQALDDGPDRTMVAPPSRLAGNGREVEARRARPPAAPKRRVWPWLLVLVLGLVVAGLGVVVFKGLSGDSNPPTTATTTAAALAPVPDVTGFTAGSARDVLERSGFKVQMRNVYSDTAPQGTVARQQPAAGQQLAKGQTVTVLVSQGIQPLSVPDVVGEAFVAGRDKLLGQGFKVAPVIRQPNDKDRGTILAQNPPSGTQAKKGDVVTLTVSSGPAAVPLPDVVGLSESSARQTLEAQGFVVTTTQAASDTVDKGNVISQDPTGQGSAAKGSTVRLTISSGAATVSVPDVVGQPADAARAALEAKGFTVKTVTVKVTDTNQDGNVVAQDPKAGSDGKAGDEVTISVGSIAA